ncbi:MAG: LysR substrate-binding domain-containing protein [Pikeienuella sp.]
MPLRFTLRQLEYFVAVGEAGGVAPAAAQINISSPTISAAITALEAEFGLQLFVRHHAQGLSLTPGGRQFYAEAKVILERADSLRDLAGDISGGVRGPLHVGSLVTLSALMPPALRRSFERAYPETKLSQTSADQARLFELLRRAEIDVALTYDMEIPQDIQLHPLTELPPYVLVSANHEWAKRDSLSVHELPSAPMILLDLPISRDYFLSVFVKRGLRPMIAERTNDMAIVRSLVANGFGFSLVNTRTNAAVAPDGAPLAFIPLIDGPPPITLGIATAASDYTPGIVSAFIAHCREKIEREGPPGLV